MAPSSLYRRFTEWRLQSHFRRPRRSVRFFRGSLDHSLIWVLVMKGHYAQNHPTIGDCQTLATGRSRLTIRKLIADAVTKGFLEIRPASEDSRKRCVHPTRRTVLEYEDMVRGYQAFFRKRVPPRS